MNPFTQPQLTTEGTVTVRGQDYLYQRLRYGSRHYVHVFRKGELHRHGLVFTGEREFAWWRDHLGCQLELELG
jgi:hypothetical protein